MLNKVRDYIHRHQLLHDGDRHLVALSGGADSVALLLTLRELGYRVEAVHCNFQLRGTESDRDEQFCVELCQRMDVILHRIHFDTRTYADLHGVSIEMAARELRYRYFEQLRQDIGAADVCVAHHRDDTVETVLLNLVRGTGLRGLTGIQPRNGNIVRPLLCVSRQEIEEHLREKGQPYVTDSTNLETDALRNKVRLQVLPLLRELNPAVATNIWRTAENLTEAQRVLDALMESYRDTTSLDLSDETKGGTTEYVVFEWLRGYGFNGQQARQILEAGTGRIFSSLTGYDVLVDRGRLLVEPTLRPLKPLRIPEPGTYVANDGALRFSVQEEPVWVSRQADVATLDAEKVTFPLTLRRVEQGDRMVPYGMTGHKLLSDLMTDSKLTLFEKRRQLVVADAHGTIVWLVGRRVDGRFAVSPTTQRVLTMRCQDGTPSGPACH